MNMKNYFESILINSASFAGFAQPEIGSTLDVDMVIQTVEEFNEKYINDSLQKLFLGKIEDISIFTVSADYVKLHYDKDFCEGGNWMVDEYMPENEIWISNDDSKNYKYVLCHELVESYLMKHEGMKYDNPDMPDDFQYAHPHANAIEMLYREKYK